MATARRGRYGDTAVAEYKKDKIVQRYTQPWIVELDGSDPDPISAADILSVPGLPRARWSTYSPRPGFVIPFAVCKTVTPKPDPKSRRLWRVNTTFELSGSEQEEPQSDESAPLDLTPRVEPFTSEIQIPMMRDFDDKVVADPFGQLYDTPVMAQLSLPGVRVTRYVDSFDENTLAQWEFTTNDAPWRGKPIDAWCIQKATGQYVQFGEGEVGQLTFNISANPLELEIEGEPQRIGWHDTRALLSSTYLDDIGEMQEFRLNGTTPTKGWINPDGTASTSTPPEQFAVFRNRERRDFSAIVDS